MRMTTTAETAPQVADVARTLRAWRESQERILTDFAYMLKQELPAGLAVSHETLRRYEIGTIDIPKMSTLVLAAWAKLCGHTLDELGAWAVEDAARAADLLASVSPPGPNGSNAVRGQGKSGKSCLPEHAGDAYQEQHSRAA